jgi:methionyl-tRNA formyltransferase
LKEIGADETFEEILPRLANLGAEALIHAAYNVDSLRSSAKTQKELLEKYKEEGQELTSEDLKAPKISSALGRINWHEMTGEEVYNRYRAYKGLISVYSHLHNKKVNLVELVHPKHLIDVEEFEGRDFILRDFLSVFDQIRILAK